MFAAPVPARRGADRSAEELISDGCGRVRARRRAGAAGARPGFSLPELTVSLAVMTVLMTGLASAILVSSRGIPQDDDARERLRATHEALSRITGDLRYSTEVKKSEAARVRIYIGDRGHGGAGAEQIEFGWSGIAGDPLQLTYNGVTRTILPDVHYLKFTYMTRVDPDDSTRTRVDCVMIELQSSADTATRVQTSVRLLNSPRNDIVIAQGQDGEDD